MATTLFDTVDLRLSRALRDPVNYTAGSGAATDGKKYSATNRNTFINRAVNLLQTAIWSKCIEQYGDTETARNVVRRILQSEVKTTSSAFTFSSSGVVIATAAGADYNNMPIALAKTGSTASFVYRSNKQDLDNNIDINVRHAYVIEAGKLYTYENGAVLNAGTGTLTYLGNDQVTQNGSTDLALSSIFWDALVDFAAWVAKYEDAELEAAKLFYERAMAFIGMVK